MDASTFLGNAGRCIHVSNRNSVMPSRKLKELCTMIGVVASKMKKTRSHLAHDVQFRHDRNLGVSVPIKEYDNCGAFRRLDGRAPTSTILCLFLRSDGDAANPRIFPNGGLILLAT